MPLRLAYVAFLPGRSPGVEKSVREKARAFAALGADIDVFVVGNGWDDPADGVTFRRIAPGLPTLVRYPLSIVPADREGC